MDYRGRFKRPLFVDVFITSSLPITRSELTDQSFHDDILRTIRIVAEVDPRSVHQRQKKSIKMK
jgi:hypothetical protein